MVHVGTVDAPVTVGDVKQIATEFRKVVGTGKDAPTTKSVDVLGWDFAFELNEVARQDAAKAGIEMRFVRIPREVLEKRAVEQGDIASSSWPPSPSTCSGRGTTSTPDAHGLRHPSRRRARRTSRRRSPAGRSGSTTGPSTGTTRTTPSTTSGRPTARATRSSDSTRRELTSTTSPATYTVVVKVIDILGNDTTKTLAVDGLRPCLVRRAAARSRQSLLEARVTTAPCVPAIRKAVERVARDEVQGRDRDHASCCSTTGSTRTTGCPDGEHVPLLRRAARGDRDAGLPVRGRSRSAGIAISLERFAEQSPASTSSSTTTSPATPSRWRPAAARPRSWRSRSPGSTSTPWLRRDDYARSFLLLAPNVIVFERLRADFAGGRIFRTDPIIPPELRIFWDFDCYMRGDPERASSQGRSTSRTSSSSTSGRRARLDDEPDDDDRRPRPDAAGVGSTRSTTSTSASSTAVRRAWSSTTRATTRTTRTASGTRSSAASTSAARAASRHSSTSPRRLATPRAGSSPGRSTTTR